MLYTYIYLTCITDRGILMTFGSGANGCLGHGNHNDVAQVSLYVKRKIKYIFKLYSCLLILDKKDKEIVYTNVSPQTENVS